jgi:hypothetical protein
MNKSKKKDVHKALGCGGLDYYNAEMGHPGFAFAYNKNKTTS